jgi:ABC-type oligopeptide transport system ATPase subunit
MSEETLLEVKGLKKYFRLGKTTLKAVDGVSFTLQKGRAFGLVGESGSGKTTTGRAVVGLYQPTEGEIFFEGKEISRLQGEKRRRAARDIQMIFQDPVSSLNPRMTVGEIVAEGLKIAGERRRAVLEKEVEETLLKVGILPKYAGRYPHEFSGGQRQRIGIARAIIMKPKLLIADEPVSALDVSVQAQVINLLSELKETMGLTVLFIAHDLSVVKYFCDEIAVMYRGKIVEQASSSELFKNPIHPYTQSLLSAIPLPDPALRGKTKRIVFTCENWEKEVAGMQLREVKKGHFVLAGVEEKWKKRWRIFCFALF